MRLLRLRPVAGPLPPTNWPDPIIEANYDFTNEWCPLGDIGPTSPEVQAMSPEANSANWSWQGLVNWNRLYACIQTALGVNWVSYDAAGPHLNRVLPLRHPIWPTYYCTNVAAIQGLRSNGTWDQLFAAGINGSISNLPDFLFRMADNYGTYKQATVTLQFSPRTYPLWPDNPPFSISSGGGVPPMVNQYVSQYCETTDIVLTIPEGIFGWQEGPGSSSGPVGGPIGPPTPVDVKTNQIIGTANVRLIWHRVPLDWAHDNRNLLVNFYRLQGTVNRTRFRNFNQQTLRCLAPKESAWRVEPCLCRNKGFPIQYSTDIEALFQYYEPVPDDVTHEPGANGLFPDPKPGAGPLDFCYGHNLLIYRNFRYYGIAPVADMQGNLAPNLPFSPLNTLAEFGELFAFWGSGPGF